jgi:predicted kinase
LPPHRARHPLRTSDATWEVYQQQQRAFEAVSADEGAQLVLDAVRAPAELARAIAERLPAAG